MIRVLSRRNGLSLVEVLVAIAVLGVIAVPMSALFGDSLFTVKYTNERIEATSVVRTIKENVTSSVKNGAQIDKYDPSDPSAKVSLKTETNGLKEDLKIMEYVNENGTGELKPNTDYKFDAIRTRGPGSSATPSSDTLIPGCPNTVEYLITIRKNQTIDYTVLKFKFMIDLNS